MPSEHSEQRPGLSRRQLLTRGAVAAGVVWAAPVIRSTAAYATTNHGTEQPCHQFFLVSINPAGKCKPPGQRADGSGVITSINDLAGAGDHGGGPLPPAIVAWLRANPRIVVKFPTVCPQLTQASDAAWAILLPEVTGPNAAGRQCRMVLGWGRKGSHYAEAYVDPNPPLPSEAGRRLIFPKPDFPPGQDQGPNGQGAVSGFDGNPSGSASTTTTSSTTTTTTTTPPHGKAGTAVSSDGAVGAEAAGHAKVPKSSTTTTTTADDPSTIIGGDGSATGDGPLGGDGTPSTSTFGPGRTLDEAVLVFCCP